MTEKDVIEAIKFLQKYQTETDKIETKTAEIDCPKNVMIQYQLLQISMEE